jgi:crossover junction endodeoxyribonuclease RuvC
LSEIVTLGIDPGLVKTGWGVILARAQTAVQFVNCGVIRTTTNASLESRLLHIYSEIQSLIAEFKPDFVAMEKVFVNANPLTSEKLIMARTAGILGVAKTGLSVNGYTPNEIKKNITGFGHASKDSVHKMVQKILNAEIINDRKQHTLDSMDAIAVALCDTFFRDSPACKHQNYK